MSERAGKGEVPVEEGAAGSGSSEAHCEARGSREETRRGALSE